MPFLADGHCSRRTISGICSAVRKVSHRVVYFPAPTNRGNVQRCRSGPSRATHLSNPTEQRRRAHRGLKCYHTWGHYSASDLVSFVSYLTSFSASAEHMRTVPGTIVRARSDEFGSLLDGRAKPCAGYGDSRIQDSHIDSLESISARNIESRKKIQIAALMLHIWIASGANSAGLLGRWDRNDLSSYEKMPK